MNKYKIGSILESDFDKVKVIEYKYSGYWTDYIYVYQALGDIDLVMELSWDAFERRYKEYNPSKLERLIFE